jgi:hypothetical protein
VVRFEDLVGDLGGGSKKAQYQLIKHLAGHLRLTLRMSDIERIAEASYSSRSPTFRKGQMGTWKAELTAEHKEAFKNIAGDLLIDLGYEQDLSW